MRGVPPGWGAGIAESGWGVGWKRDRELFCELVAIHFYVNIKLGWWIHLNNP